MRNISPLFSRQSPLSLAKRLKALAAAAHAKTIKEIAAFIDWRPFPATVPRGNCRHLTIPLRGIPKRLHASTIRLQLLNLTGLAAIGFAWKLSGDEAEVWHWDEEKFRNTVDFPLTESLINGIQPQPEMLLRSTTLPDGLHLLACRNGYEALSIAGARLIKTRWFSRPPDDTAWQGFVRDAGRVPEENPRPAPTSPSLGNKLARDWKISSTLTTPMATRWWAIGGGVLLIGMILSALLAYDIKQQTLLTEQQATLTQLKQEKSAIIDLQNQLRYYTTLFDTLLGTQPKFRQLQLMDALTETGLFAEGTKISLLEWEYRNDRLRLLFAVPKDDFRLELFLSTLENSGILQDIRLMPDTPPLTIGIQAVVNMTAYHEKQKARPSSGEPTENAVPESN